MAHIQIHSIREQMDAALDDFCLETPNLEILLTGLNCMPAFAKDGFWEVKNKYGKTNGIICWFGKIFYETHDRPLTEFHRISLEFADSVWGRYYQVLVRTEKQECEVITRLLINSVSFSDGYKLNNNEKNWYYLQHRLNQICQKYRPSLERETPECNPTKQALNGLTGLERIEKKYELLRTELDRALNASDSLEELVEQLYADGYDCNIAPRLKYWTITPKGMQRGVRIDRLGETYSKQEIEIRLMKNKMEKEKQSNS